MSPVVDLRDDTLLLCLLGQRYQEPEACQFKDKSRPAAQAAKRHSIAYKLLVRYAMDDDGHTHRRIFYLCQAKAPAAQALALPPQCGAAIRTSHKSNRLILRIGNQRPQKSTENTKTTWINQLAILVFLLGPK